MTRLTRRIFTFQLKSIKYQRRLVSQGPHIAATRLIMVGRPCELKPGHIDLTYCAITGERGELVNVGDERNFETAGRAAYRVRSSEPYIFSLSVNRLSNTKAVASWYLSFQHASLGVAYNAGVIYDRGLALRYINCCCHFISSSPER